MLPVATGETSSLAWLLRDGFPWLPTIVVTGEGEPTTMGGRMLSRGAWMGGWVGGRASSWVGG